jgi:hypothetical protein
MACATNPRQKLTSFVSSCYISTRNDTIWLREPNVALLERCKLQLALLI